jgi:hypothetical protein
MSGTSKAKTRKSDRMGSHHESTRIGERPSGWKAVYGQWKAQCIRTREIKERQGRPNFNQDSRLCLCGEPALRVWGGRGWCKACYAAEKPKVKR